ncbi:LysE family translocator [Saccharothrix sp. AJ9571]|nr:LysE family translocator [Saccharothrix sp. AJ9571]
MTSTLLAFVPVAALLVVTPGPDMALVTKNALDRGRPAALATAFGIEAGLLVWTAASVLGIVTVLRSSEVAFTVLKLAGAAYLVYLGVTAFLSLRSPPAAAEPAPRPGRGSPFRQGLLSNVFNPKIAIFFTSFIPQFVTPGPSAVVESLVLAGIFLVMGLAWLSGFALFASTAGALLRRPVAHRVLTVATGCVLIAFGVMLAFDLR